LPASKTAWRRTCAPSTSSSAPAPPTSPPRRSRSAKRRSFRKYLKELKDAYLERSLSLAKFQFPKDIWNGKYRNPFAPEKQRVREFALHWELDPELIAILG
jgi:hypothetical protein